MFAKTIQDREYIFLPEEDVNNILGQWGWQKTRIKRMAKFVGTAENRCITFIFYNYRVGSIGATYLAVRKVSRLNTPNKPRCTQEAGLVPKEIGWGRIRRIW
jgi:hypothetical protein